MVTIRSALVTTTLGVALIVIVTMVTIRSTVATTTLGATPGTGGCLGSWKVCGQV